MGKIPSQRFLDFCLLWSCLLPGIFFLLLGASNKQSSLRLEEDSSRKVPNRRRGILNLFFFGQKIIPLLPRAKSYHKLQEMPPIFDLEEKTWECACRLLSSVPFLLPSVLLLQRPTTTNPHPACCFLLFLSPSLRPKILPFLLLLFLVRSLSPSSSARGSARKEERCFPKSFLVRQSEEGGGGGEETKNHLGFWHHLSKCLIIEECADKYVY